MPLLTIHCPLPVITAVSRMASNLTLCPPAVVVSALNLSEYEFHGSNSSEQRELWEAVLKSASYALVFFLAIVGNMLVILVVMCNQHMRTTTNFYLVNLAAADLTIALFCMWTHLVKHLAYPLFVLGPFMCRVDAFIQMTALTSSVLTLTAISCDRFFAVMFPLRARFTKQRASGVVSAIWILAIASSTPFIFHREYSEIRWKDYIQPQCGDVWPAKSQYDSIKGLCEVSYPTKRLYYTFFSVALFFFPITIMSITYFLLLWKLWVSRLPGEQNNTNVSIQARAKRKVIKMVLTVLMVFLVCWMPLQALLLYGVYGHIAHDHGQLPLWFSSFEYIAYFIAYSNSAINPIIYCGFNENFRRGMIAMLSCNCLRDFKANSIRSTKITHLGGSERRKEAPVLPSFEHEMAELMVKQRNETNSKLSGRQLKITPKYINKNTGHLNGDIPTDLSALSLADTRELMSPSKTNEKNCV